MLVVSSVDLALEVSQLVDETHVRPNPSTTLLHSHVHSMEIRLVVLEKSVRDDE